MIRAWFTTKFIQITDRAHASFSRFMDGVMDQIHELDRKDPNHQFWHPECPSIDQNNEDTDSAQTHEWFPETSAMDNSWPSQQEHTHPTSSQVEENLEGITK